MTQFAGKREHRFKQNHVGCRGWSLFQFPERLDKPVKHSRPERGIPGDIPDGLQDGLPSLKPLERFVYAGKETQRFGPDQHIEPAPSRGTNHIEDDEEIKHAKKATPAVAGGSGNDRDRTVAPGHQAQDKVIIPEGNPGNDKSRGCS